jgi:hypothetical protein
LLIIIQGIDILFRQIRGWPLVVGAFVRGGLLYNV